MLRHFSLSVVHIARCLAGNLFLAGVFFLTGCATPQTSTLLAQPIHSLPPRIELQNVPYYAQEAHQCGPAALAMALNANGQNVTPQQLEAQVYLPGKEGSLQVEMQVATRRHGLIAYELAPHLDDLLREVAAGQPVIVLQNLSFNWYPMWHYAVVIGYDLERKEILLRSGPEQRQALPLTTFEHTWARSNYWALLPLPTDRLPQTAVENRYVDAATALEQSRQTTAANNAYQTALRRWPENLTALMGLGNTSYALNNFASAENAFRRATQFHPDAAVAFNNLADTLARERRYTEALRAAQEAVRIGGEQQATFAQTFAEIKAQLPP